MSELESEFASVGGEKPQPTRYLRSQRPKDDFQAGGDVQAGGDTADGMWISFRQNFDIFECFFVGAQVSTAAATPAEVDPWEFMSPFDLLTKLPSSFYEQLESKKWSERKEKLEELEKLLKDNPRLEPNGAYGELVSTLKKVSTTWCNISIAIFRFLLQVIAKDSNINVVAVAGKCMADLASGLRKKFGAFAPMVSNLLFAQVLLKFDTTNYCF